MPYNAKALHGGTLLPSDGEFCRVEEAHPHEHFGPDRRHIMFKLMLY